MHSELVPGTTNVFRFPQERVERPTIDVLRELAPDVRLVLNLAEAFGFEAPDDRLRDQADAETAAYLAAQLPGSGLERSAMLADLEARAVNEAVTAARAALDAQRVAETARRAAKQGAERPDVFWGDGLEERAGAVNDRAVLLTLQAHTLAELAEGAARAVGFARRQETWSPRDHAAEDNMLIAMAAAR